METLPTVLTQTASLLFFRSINQSINLRLLVACQNASQQLTVIHVALVQQSCA